MRGLTRVTALKVKKAAVEEEFGEMMDKKRAEVEAIYASARSEL